MSKMDIAEAKDHLPELIAEAVSGEEVVITQNNQPVVKLVLVPQVKRRRQAGSAKGLVTISDDFDEPLEDFREYIT